MEWMRIPFHSVNMDHIFRLPGSGVGPVDCTNGVKIQNDTYAVNFLPEPGRTY
jgi:hypothetical protein